MKSYVCLFASILVAFGGWAYGTGPWGELLGRAYLPILIAQIGSIIIAWLSPNPEMPDFVKNAMAKFKK